MLLGLDLLDEPLLLEHVSLAEQQLGHNDGDKENDDQNGDVDFLVHYADPLKWNRKLSSVWARPAISSSVNIAKSLAMLKPDSA